MKIISLLFCFIIMLCCLTQSFASDVYRWVDAQGNVHFSEKPAADAKQVKQIKIHDVPEHIQQQATERKQQLLKSDKVLDSKLEQKRTQRLAIRKKLQNAYSELDAAKQDLQTAQNKLSNVSSELDTCRQRAWIFPHKPHVFHRGGCRALSDQYVIFQLDIHKQQTRVDNKQDRANDLLEQLDAVK